MQPRRRIDSCNPKSTKLSFSLTTITIGVLPRLNNSLFCYPVSFAPGTLVAFRLTEDLLVTGFRDNPTFYSSHCASLTIG